MIGIPSQNPKASDWEPLRVSLSGLSLRVWKNRTFPRYTTTTSTGKLVGAGPGLSDTVTCRTSVRRFSFNLNVGGPATSQRGEMPVAAAARAMLVLLRPQSAPQNLDRLVTRTVTSAALVVTGWPRHEVAGHCELP
eukprot:3179040-Rhodomonas_salina.1